MHTRTGLGSRAARAFALALPGVAHGRAGPLWDVSGRWNGVNGAEYVVLKQRSGGRLAVTVHHACAPGHVERGTGRISAGRLRARSSRPSSPSRLPASPSQPSTCAWTPTGAVCGRYTTDRDAGALEYVGRRRARSLVRFHPRIERAGGGTLRVFLRPRPKLPRGAAARVRLCLRSDCATSSGSHAPRIRLRSARCGLFRARVSFAGSVATTRRRLCI